MGGAQRFMCRGGWSQVSSGRHGFTLVELLVVIAVISILASLLLPVLQKAREGAWAITCANNIKTVGLSIIMFADDNDGRGPSKAQRWGSNPNGDTYWQNVLNNVMFEGQNRIFYYSGAVPVGTTYRAPSGKIVCPKFETTESYVRGYALNNNVAAAGPQITNGVPSPWISWWLGQRLNRFKRPSYQILTRNHEYNADGCGANFPYDVMTMSVTKPHMWSGVPFRHNGSSSFSFFDNHVELRKPEGDLNSQARYNP